MDAKALDNTVAQLDHLTLQPPTSSECPLFELPAELRNLIYEYALREPSSEIIVDFRDGSNFDSPRNDDLCPSNDDVSYALTMTCKRIYKECANLRYEVNEVHIGAPVFNPETFVQYGASERASIVDQLRRLAEAQTRTKQLNKAEVFLGSMPHLTRIRWMDFLSRWMSILDSLKLLRQHTPGLRLAFEVSLQSKKNAQLRFNVATPEDVARGFAKITLRDGSDPELTATEADRLQKFKATMIKTLFADDVRERIRREGRSSGSVNFSDRDDWGTDELATS